MSGARNRKGAPLARGTTGRPIAADRRPATEKTMPIQVWVPPAVFEAFSERAGADFGFKKGAKSQLFLEMWRRYNGSMG